MRKASFVTIATLGAAVTTLAGCTCNGCSEDDTETDLWGETDTDPADTDPVDTDPVDTDPADTDPVDTDPVDTDPADTDTDAPSGT